MTTWILHSTSALLLTILALGASAALTQPLPQKDTEYSEMNKQSGIGGMAETATQNPPKRFDWLNTSSPRNTLESLLVGMQRYFDLVGTDGYTRKNWREATNLVIQAERLFDLRNVPPEYRDDVAHETTVLLREALARVPLPPLEEAPDAEQMSDWIKAGKPPVYRVPGTPFEIARTDAGPYTGRYQFTQDAVDHAADFYEEIKSYPYQPGQVGIEGLYEAYFLLPGPMISHEWIRVLPSWMQHQFLGQTVWQWLFLFIVANFLVAIIILLNKVIRRLSRGWSQLSRHLLKLLRPLTTIVLTIYLAQFIDHDIRITGEVALAVGFVKHIIILLAGVVLTVGTGNVLADLVLAAKRFEHRQLDQQLIHLLMRVISILIAGIIVIEQMHQIGFSVATLLAGAGVGGLAIALAAQDTLKNIFGGIELSLDKPFVVGQRVKMRGYEGEIEEIGLRSTKIRTLTGHQVTIPNQDAATLDIENIGRRPFIRRDFSINITYDTPPEKIDRALDILRDILAVPEETETHTIESTTNYDTDSKPHPNEAINNVDLPPRVYFNELNPDSLNLLIVYWYHPPVYWDYLEHATWINRQIIMRFNAERIDFAFPTQTLHLEGHDERHFSSDQ